MNRGKYLVIFKRTGAFFIDYMVMTLWIGLMFLLGISLIKAEIGWENLFESSVLAHLISLSSVTLPVLIYFSLAESSEKRGSIGKDFFDLIVVKAEDPDSGLGFCNSLRRNILKFLPWELAHILLHYGTFDAVDSTKARLTLISLTFVALVPFLFFFEIVLRKDQRTSYDRFSDSSVIENKGRFRR